MRGAVNELSVLVVDDNEINLMLMEDILEILSIGNVKTIDSGLGAVSEIQSGSKYDVVVMDICMPQMSGYEAAQKIRQLGFMGKIIALTAFQLSKDDPEFLDSQMDDILLKPIDINEIQRVLCA
ncbi:MAG TPA: response regulator [Firmicutes bacterium]|nr:response regulator [Bacillota bacterium]